MKIEFYYYLIYSNSTGKNIDEIINISSIYIIYHKNINNIFDGGGVYKNVIIKLNLKVYNTIKIFLKHKLKLKIGEVKKWNVIIIQM
ncbi:hypothetical protein [Fusobacterium vincentii]|uniref:hypothetical protein n=1 Tax=Fusobacterium vincentii TaxID=155615 RepID=UPI001C6EE981|nr:hypothetical protein [Fusobacterium vincentii]QYR57644.1 hypothetical protein JY399_03390 [Fusobacterium vincentii]